MRSCLYTGQVTHTRYRPVAHRFRYRLFLPYLDLAELDTVFARRWLWSTRRLALARFSRKDHLGDPALPLDTVVREYVETKSGVRPAGPIRLLTQLRYYGYFINPVCFYYCFNEDDTELKAIVAEVTNTPWGERHCYVLAPEVDGQSDRALTFQHEKEFHVSPFMGMDLEYRWKLSLPGEALTVHIQNLEAGERLFDASLSLRRRPITGRTLACSLLRHPFLTGKIAWGIYFQALRLWWKRVPFYPHPHHKSATQVGD